MHHDGTTTTSAGGSSGVLPRALGAVARVCRVVRAADAARQRWRNGGGITHQIAIWPPDAQGSDFAWRISAAEVSEPGDFSDWSGFDRQLWITHGAGVRLTDPATGAVTELRPGAALDFPGERRYACALLDGPVRDFNLMLRRGAGTLRSRLIRGTGADSLQPGHNLFYCVQGSVQLSANGKRIAALAAGDTLHIALDAGTAECSVSLAADDTAACIAVHIAAAESPTQPGTIPGSAPAEQRLTP